MSYSEMIITSFYLFAILGLLIKTLLNFRNINYIHKHSFQVPEEFSQQISLEDHQLAAKYSTTKLKFSIFTNFLHFLILLAWIPMGGFHLLDQYFVQFDLSIVNHGVIFFVSYILISMLITIPENLYTTFCIEEKYKFNKVTPKIFIIDFLKQILLVFIFAIPLLYAVLFLMNKIENNWWILAWALVTLFQFIIIWAYPKFIAPLFNKFTPLDDEELVQKINLLSLKTEIQFKDYFVMNASLRSSHGNAYFTGFGKNKRIVFFDTLLKSLSPKEIIAVLAHELGHLKKKHILKSLLLNFCSMGIGFYILGFLNKSDFFFKAFKVNSSAYMALILFLSVTPIYTFFLTPLSSWFSRKNEFEADQFATQNSSGADLISSLIKMYKDNSSTLTPDPLYASFYFSHPTALNRVRFIKKIEDTNLPLEN